MLDLDELLKAPIEGVNPNSILTEDLCNQLQIHALEDYPNECVGYVKDGVYHRLENLSKEPENSVAIEPATLHQLLVDEIDMLCHSHPDGPDCPSKPDMILQAQMDIPHCIVSTNGKGCLPPFFYGDMLQRPPLLGRAFRHGTQDCYGLVRDFYETVMGKFLEDCPRDWEWWTAENKPEDGLYEENFRKWGFKEVEDDLRLGDVFLLKAGANVPNHAGIYLGDSLILHHLAGRQAADHSRISTREPVLRWQQHQRISKVVRHGG